MAFRRWTCFFLLSTLFVLATGCDSGGGEPSSEEVLNDGELALGTVVARIDDSPFEATGALALDSGGLTLAATTPDGTLITTGVLGFSGKDTYSVSQGAGAARIDLPQQNAGPISFLTNLGGDGAVEVTDVTEESIKGTFQFTAFGEDENSVQVTDGAFHVPRIEGVEAIKERVCDDEIFIVAQERPELIGGAEALQERIVYPEFAEEAGIEGRVFVQVIIGPQGEVFDAQVTQGVHPLLDPEAARLGYTSSFRPARQRGEAVCFQESLPVTFQLR
jgi:TonB family protein